MKSEIFARGLALIILLGLPLGLWFGRQLVMGESGQVVEIHARIPEKGGWAPADIQAVVGKPLHLRLVSDDVVHGFAIGGEAAADLWPALDLIPGKVVETEITFNKPGMFTYYCTRWCGLNHWRMRGTIQVNPAPGLEQAAASTAEVEQPPLFVQLGLDIDAPHPSQVIPQGKPSAEAGEDLGIQLPDRFLTLDYYRSHSPAQVWQELRLLPKTEGLSDDQVWNLVAWIWRSHTTENVLSEGRRLYAENCAACHGETGAGDGVFAHTASQPDPSVGAHAMETQATGTATMGEHGLKAPADFTDAAQALGASPAVWQGKIVRGGMGTGMPYWGPIFTEAQFWALVDYLWTFQFELEYEK
jgi:cytochrome c oxidase subunit 2